MVDDKQNEEPLPDDVREQFLGPPHRRGQPTKRQREAIDRSLARRAAGLPPAEPPK